MTFQMWYQEVEKKPYRNLTAREKSALTGKFWDYLRETRQAEPAEVCIQEETIIAVSYCTAAHG